MWRHSSPSDPFEGATSRTSTSPLSSSSSFSSTFTSYDFLPLLLIWPLAIWALIYFAPPILSASLRIALSFVSQPNEARDDGKSPAAYVVSGSTSHARFLPVSAKHSFRYPTLYLGLELAALESGRLDRKWIFKYKGLSRGQPAAPSWSSTALQSKRANAPPSHEIDADDESIANHITRQADLASSRITDASLRYTLSSLNPSAYLRTSFPSVAPKSTLHSVLSSSIRSKLAWELRHRGYLSFGPQDASADNAERWEDAGGKKEMGQVWMITMPSLVGVQGINPLSVYYVHRPAEKEGERGEFWLCVLEVHNTFSERHVYILEAGVAEDVGEAKRGDADDEEGGRHKTHRWTFPRSFHVSPFNDRGGWYRLTLKELFSAETEGGDGKPLLGIQLRLLIPAEGEGEGEGGSDIKDGASESSFEHVDGKTSSPPAAAAPANVQLKLLATLNSSPKKVKPFSAINYATSVARQPFDLLLPFLRIMKEAGRLHWKRGLRVWGKPEPRELGSPSASASASSDDDGEGEVGKAGNEVQLFRSATAKGRTREESKRAGAVFYQPETAGERTARVFVEKALRRRLQDQTLTSTEKEKEKGNRIAAIEISPADAGGKGLHLVASSSGAEDAANDSAKIRIRTRSQQVFTDLVLWPSFRVARLVAQGSGARWSVAPRGDAEEPSLDFAEGRGGKPSVWDTLAKWIRRRHIEWQLRCAGIVGESDRAEALHLLGLASTDEKGTLKLPPHPLSPVRTTPRVVTLLAAHHTLAVVEKWASERLGVRYVQGQEPWGEVGRAVQFARRERDRKGKEGRDGGKGRGGEEPWDTKLGSSSWIDEP